MPLTSALCPKAAKPEHITKTSGSGTDYILPHAPEAWGQHQGPQAVITWPAVASWATVVCSEGPIQEVNLSSSRVSITAQSQGYPKSRRQVQGMGLSLCLNKLQAVIYHPTNPTGQDGLLISASFSLIYYHHHAPSSTSLHSTRATLFFSVFPNSPSHICSL